MKKTTVKAYNGAGKDKTFAGERIVDEPETLAEAVQLEGGDEKEVLSAYWSSKVIDIQRQIRSGTTISAKAQLNMLLAKAKTDPKIAELLRSADIKLPGDGNGEDTEKGAEAPTPTPPEAPKAPEEPAKEPPKPSRRR